MGPRPSPGCVARRIGPRGLAPGCVARRRGEPRPTSVRRSLGGFHVAFDRRADADQVAVAIDVVDPADGGPVLVHPEGAGREAALLAACSCGPSRPPGRSPCGGRGAAGCPRRSISPRSTARISSRIARSAVMKRSISALVSDSVGSTISVPATGQLIVGAWKPLSIRRLAMSSTVTPASAKGRVSRMHSCATRPRLPMKSTS